MHSRLPRGVRPRLEGNAQLYTVGPLRKQELHQKGASCSEQRDKEEDARTGEEEVVDEKEDKPEKRVV